MGGVGLQDSGTGLPYPSRVSGGSVFPLLTTLLKRVLMSPGAKQFTLMFFEASSAAKFLVRPSKAVLLTLYGPRAWGKENELVHYFAGHHWFLLYDEGGSPKGASCKGGSQSEVTL